MKNNYAILEKEYLDTIMRLSEITGWPAEQAESVVGLVVQAAEKKANAVAERKYLDLKDAKFLATKKLLQNYRRLREAINLGTEHALKLLEDTEYQRLMQAEESLQNQKVQSVALIAAANRVLWARVSWSIFSVFFYKLSKIEDEIVSGAFDVYLLRPVSPFLQLVDGDIKYTHLCDTLLGAVLVPMGLAMNGTHWGLWQILWFVVFVLSGGAIAVCIKFLIACVTFWTTKANALNQVFIQIYLLTQKYPVTIFGPAFRVLVTGLVPVAYLNYYPAVFLLGKPDVPPWMCMLAPVVALVLVGISAIVWRGGLRRYNSCGG